MMNLNRNSHWISVWAFLLLWQVAAPSAQAQQRWCHKLAPVTTSSPNWMSAKSKKIVEQNGKKNSDDPSTFVTNRGWNSYVSSLIKKIYSPEGKISYARWAHPLFSALGKNDVLLDVGCGDSFLSDIFFENFHLGPYSGRSDDELPSYVGITYALNQRTLDFFDSRIASGKMQLKVGNFFEDVDVKSLLRPGQKIKLITDYYGVMSYTERPDLLMKRYLELLSDDGSIAILGQTRIKIAGNKKIFDLLTYLGSIQGIDIEYTSENDGAILIKKNGFKIQVPELRMSSPPRDIGSLPYLRTFRLTGNVFDISEYADLEP